MAVNGFRQNKVKVIPDALQTGDQFRTEICHEIIVAI